MSGLQVNTGADGFISDFSVVGTGGGFKFDCDPPKTRCYYKYQFPVYYPMPVSCTGLETTDQMNASAVVTFVGAFCEDPATTQLVGAGWVLISQSEANGIGTCIFEKVIATNDKCIDAVTHCSKGEELKPAPPTQAQAQALGCKCENKYPLPTPTSDAAEWSDANCRNSLPWPVPTSDASEWSDANCRNSLPWPDPASDAEAVSPQAGDGTTKTATGGNGFLRVTYNITFSGCGYAQYTFKIKGTLNGTEYTYYVSLSAVASTTTTQTATDSKITSYSGDWSGVSVTCTDYYQNTCGCPSNAAMSGSFAVTVS